VPEDLFMPFPVQEKSRLPIYGWDLQMERLRHEAKCKKRVKGNLKQYGRWGIQRNQT